MLILYKKIKFPMLFQLKFVYLISPIFTFMTAITTSWLHYSYFLSTFLPSFLCSFLSSILNPFLSPFFPCFLQLILITFLFVLKKKLCDRHISHIYFMQNFMRFNLCLSQIVSLTVVRYNERIDCKQNKHIKCSY